jgi:uncharacterized membrane protein
MARFGVRVELHEVKKVEPTWDDYEELHLAMQRKSYFRVIQSDKSVWYHLPHAEYTVSWDVEIATVLKEVKEIVSSVWENYGALVTKSAGQTWTGLKTATQQEANQLTDTAV